MATRKLGLTAAWIAVGLIISVMIVLWIVWKIAK